MGSGVFTQHRWWFAHTPSGCDFPACFWRARNRTDAPSPAFQSRTGFLGYRPERSK